MITCEICGTQAEQHDHWRHEIMSRVAALEDVVTREPAEDEQPVSAGEAPKRCPHGVPSHLGCWNCTSRYVKIGDVVMDEPPAEQPTGCPGCACCNDDACPTRHADCHHAEQPIRQETGGDCGVPGCHACAAMRDRAQAEAAEQDDEDGGMCCHFNEDRRAPRSCTKDRGHDGPHHYGPRPTKQPAEPSETGQVASTPVCDGGKAVACLLKIVEIVNSNGNQEVVFGDDGGGCALTVRIGNHGCHVHMGAGPRLAAGKPEDSRYVAKMVDELHDYLFSHECSERDKDGPREPIAEPPAPAAGTLRDAGLTADTMPKEVLAMLYERATDTLIEARQLRKDQVAALEARLAQAERERDELGRQVEQMAAHVSKMRMELDEAVERLKCEACTDAKSILCATCIDREERDATGRERERCLAWWNWFWGDTMSRNIQTEGGIRSGAPAPKCDPDPPREVAPDRTPCSELCGSKFIVEARREVIAGDRKSVHERDGHCYSTIACLTARKCVNK